MTPSPPGEGVTNITYHGLKIVMLQDCVEYAPRDRFVLVPKEKADEYEMDGLASHLIDVWVANYGQMPWAKAVEVVAIVKHLPAEERLRLLALDDAAASKDAERELPPLPAMHGTATDDGEWYSAGQMRAYALAARAESEAGLATLKQSYLH